MANSFYKLMGTTKEGNKSWPKYEILERFTLFCTKRLLDRNRCRGSPPWFIRTFWQHILYTSFYSKYIWFLEGRNAQCRGVQRSMMEGRTEVPWADPRKSYLSMYTEHVHVPIQSHHNLLLLSLHTQDVNIIGHLSSSHKKQTLVNSVAGLTWMLVIWFRLAQTELLRKIILIHNSTLIPTLTPTETPT